MLPVSGSQLTPGQAELPQDFPFSPYLMAGFFAVPLAKKLGAYEAGRVFLAGTMILIYLVVIALHRAFYSEISLWSASASSSWEFKGSILSRSLKIGITTESFMDKRSPHCLLGRRIAPT